MKPSEQAVPSVKARKQSDVQLQLPEWFTRHNIQLYQEITEIDDRIVLVDELRDPANVTITTKRSDHSDINDAETSTAAQQKYEITKDSYDTIQAVVAGLLATKTNVVSTTLPTTVVFATDQKYCDHVTASLLHKLALVHKADIINLTKEDLADIAEDFDHQYESNGCYVEEPEKPKLDKDVSTEASSSGILTPATEDESTIGASEVMQKAADSKTVSSLDVPIAAPGVTEASASGGASADLPSTGLDAPTSSDHVAILESDAVLVVGEEGTSGSTNHIRSGDNTSISTGHEVDISRPTTATPGSIKAVESVGKVDEPKSEVPKEVTTSTESKSAKVDEKKDKPINEDDQAGRQKDKDDKPDGKKTKTGDTTVTPEPKKSPDFPTRKHDDGVISFFFAPLRHLCDLPASDEERWKAEDAFDWSMKGPYDYATACQEAWKAEGDARRQMTSSLILESARSARAVATPDHIIDPESSITRPLFIHLVDVLTLKDTSANHDIIQSLLWQIGKQRAKDRPMILFMTSTLQRCGLKTSAYSTCTCIDCAPVDRMLNPVFRLRKQATLIQLPGSFEASSHVQARTYIRKLLRVLRSRMYWSGISANIALHQDFATTDLDIIGKLKKVTTDEPSGSDVLINHLVGKALAVSTLSVADILDVLSKRDAFKAKKPAIDEEELTHKAKDADDELDDDDAPYTPDELTLMGRKVNAKDIEETFDDVIIDEDKMRNIKQVVRLATLRTDRIKNKLLKRLRVPGIMLHGPPGTGKTQLVRAIANSMKANMLSLEGADIKKKWLGESEQNVRSAFSLARKLHPCILFIDEADGMFYKRQADDQPWHRSILTEFLGEMDGLGASKKTVLVIVATNRVKDLDDAFMRRLPYKVEFTMPDEGARAKILGLQLKETTMDEREVDIAGLAACTKGYSGSDIRSFCQNALLAWYADQDGNLNELNTAGDLDVQLKREHFEQALQETKPYGSGLKRKLPRPKQSDKTSISAVPDAVISPVQHEDNAVVSPNLPQEAVANKSSSTSLQDSRVTEQQPPAVTPVPPQELTITPKIASPTTIHEKTLDIAPSTAFDMNQSAIILAPSIHTPLHTESKQIRLLRILPKGHTPHGESPERLYCEIRVVSLLEEPDYECISYCWDESVIESIQLGQHSVSVSSNLAAALRHFRKLEEEDKSDVDGTWLWADALCIRQHDIQERNEQIAIMAEIFSKAARVRAWLRWDHDDLARQTARDIAASCLLGFRALETQDAVPSTQQILCLGALFKNRFWKRLWILQELALAQNIGLYYGPLAYDFHGPRSFSSIYENGFKLLFRFYRGESEKHAAMKLSLTDYAERFADNMLSYDMTSMMPALLFSIIPVAGDVSLCQDVITAHRSADRFLLNVQRQCSRKHDYVYGLLGILQGKVKITPDYARPWSEVLTEFSFKLFEANQNLRQLISAMSASTDIPSWVIDPARATEVEEQDISNPFLITQAIASEPYRASDGSSFKMLAGQSGSIKVPVMLVSKVKVLEPQPDFDNLDFDKCVQTPAVLKAIRDKMRFYAEALNDIRYDTDEIASGGVNMDLLRALLHDVEAIEAPEEPAGLRGAGPISFDALERYKTDVDDFLETGEWSGELKIFHALALATPVSRLFVTSTGKLGMAAGELEIGDHICVIATCPRPFCIRPKERDGVSGYMLVAESYADGCAFGEALSDRMKVLQAQTKDRVVEVDDAFEMLTLV